MMGGVIAASRRVAAAFDPLSLFSAGQIGIWYDPSDLSSMNTLADQTGTTPTVGDPVGYIEDKSGNLHHGKQTVLASRPLLQQDVNGNYYLELDGVDDELANDGSWALDSEFSILLSGSTVSSAANDGFFAIGPRNASPLSLKQRSLGLENNNTLKVDVRTETATVSTDLSTRSVFEGQFNAPAAGGIFAAVNGGTFSENPVTFDALKLGDEDFSLGKGITEQFIKEDVYGLIVVDYRLLGTARSDAVQYLAAKAGVTL